MKSYKQETRDFWTSLDHWHYVGKLPDDSNWSAKQDMEWDEYIEICKSRPCLNQCYPFDENSKKWSEEEQLKKTERNNYLKSLFEQNPLS